MSKGRGRKRADRIREMVPMAKVLEAYGYAVSPDAGDREQQFSCDLHGDGSDGTPSARFYPESNSAYCFACGRTRDAISWSMEKEGLDFSSACKKLELRFHLPPLPWDDDEKHDHVPLVLDHQTTFADETHRVDRMLQNLTLERSLPMTDTLRLWHDFDKVAYGVAHEAWDERRGKIMYADIRQRVLTAIQSGNDE